MLKRFLRRREQPVRAPEIPPGMRVYAVGDIHGRLDLLRQMHEQIAGDTAGGGAHRTVVVYLGDYVDRGSESRQVIEFLLDKPLAGVEPRYLCGNHEEMMLAFLDDASVGPVWMYNGGDATLLSYGVGQQEGASLEERHARMQQRLREVLPPAHLEFLRSLQLYHVEGDYLFVHAGILPGRAIEDQSAEDLLWIREEFLSSEANHGKCVVHGHTIVPTVELRGNRIGIDTGAYYSGTLTCLVLEGTEQRLLQT